MERELLINCAVKGTLVLLAAGALCGILRRASAAIRHMVWAAAFVALLLLPLFSLAPPVWTARAPAIVELGGFSADAVAADRAGSGASGWISLVWLAGAAVVLARFGGGLARVWLLTRRGRPIATTSTAQGVKLLDGGPGVMPMTWGVLRPVILLPSEAVEWPAARLRAALLHELAHVARRDWLTLAISEVALALYWFHPLAWWAAARLRREREQACDDRVLSAGVIASDYAGDLVAIARSLDAAPDSSIAAPAMARASNLESRLRAILDPRTRRRSVTSQAAAMMAVGLVALLPLASLRLLGQGAGLTGAIYDSSGAVVPKATVTIRNRDSGAEQSVASDAAGAYAFPNLPAGRYQVMVSQPGFAVYARQAVAVPGSLDVVLSLGQVSESVVVSGRRSQMSPPPPAPRRIPVGGNVQPAKLIYQPRPVYPARAEAAGIEGRVLLRATIQADGAVAAPLVLSTPDAELGAAALDAVRRWRYQAALLNGQPVDVVTTLSVDFRLDR